jgi:hypothetical protein
VWFLVRNVYCIVTIDSLFAHSKTTEQNAFLFPVLAMSRHDCPLAVESTSAPCATVTRRNLERYIHTHALQKHCYQNGYCHRVPNCCFRFT